MNARVRGRETDREGEGERTFCLCCQCLQLIGVLLKLADGVVERSDLVSVEHLDPDPIFEQSRVHLRDQLLLLLAVLEGLLIL
jgi:hypothetical protein